MRRDTRWGRIVPRAMVPSGAGTREGMENTSYPSLRLILFVSASRIRRTLQRCKKRENWRGGKKRKRGDGLSIFIMFASKKERQRGKKRKMEEGSETGGNTRVESVHDARKNLRECV